MRAIAWRGGLECESTAGPLAESAPPLIPANGLAFEVFEAGEGDRLALLLHGFPQHAVSWHNIIYRDSSDKENGAKFTTLERTGWGLWVALRPMGGDLSPYPQRFRGSLRYPCAGLYLEAPRPGPSDASRHAPTVTHSQPLP
ncbi:MAG: hypothetical protein USCAAHI_00176 [Beijerinckiaceae bacterium]|nr:MAG: hypothetical protein USCAAHI_00176 [Beijerinckiaceae bacterium]